MKLEDMLNMPVEQAGLKASLESFGLEGDLTYKDALYVSVIQSAISGDAKAAQYLLENADSEKDALVNTVLGDIQKKRTKKQKNAKNRTTKAKN